MVTHHAPDIANDAFRVCAMATVTEFIEEVEQEIRFDLPRRRARMLTLCGAMTDDVLGIVLQFAKQPREDAL